MLELAQQFWALLLELEKWMLVKRKEASLPNSIQPQEPQLFSNEDLKNEQVVQRINRAGAFTSERKLIFPSSAGSSSGTQCLCPSTGWQGFKFRKYGKGIKGGKGVKGGKGSWQAAPSWGRSAFKGKGKGHSACPEPSARPTEAGNIRQDPQWPVPQPAADTTRPLPLCKELKINMPHATGTSTGPLGLGGRKTPPHCCWMLCKV